MGDEEDLVLDRQSCMGRVTIIAIYFASPSPAFAHSFALATSQPVARRRRRLLGPKTDLWCWLYCIFHYTLAAMTTATARSRAMPLVWHLRHLCSSSSCDLLHLFTISIHYCLAIWLHSGIGSSSDGNIGSSVGIYGIVCSCSTSLD